MSMSGGAHFILGESSINGLHLVYSVRVMKILFLGDIVGKPGRKAIAKVLPEWKKEHDPDLVIANGENMAHGSGFTLVGFEEVQKAGVDFFTSGNHWPRKEEGMLLFSGKKY